MKRLPLGLLAAAVVTACSTGSGSGPSLSPPAVAPISPVAGGTPAAASLDQAFIDMMVPHHQSAVEMAQLAQDRAEHDELKTLADHQRSGAGDRGDEDVACRVVR